MMNEKMKRYILSNWKEYDLVDSEEEMLKVLNILEAHDENLDSLHDITIGNRDWLCGIWISSNPETGKLRRPFMNTIFFTVHVLS